MAEAKKNDPEDAKGVTPYDIEGYEWSLKDGEEIGKGTLLPGYEGEVYEIHQEAGYSLNLQVGTHYVVIMVDDGEYNHLPEWRQASDREEFTKAMKDRVTTTRLEDEKEYWTLTETDE